MLTCKVGCVESPRTDLSCASVPANWNEAEANTLHRDYQPRLGRDRGRLIVLQVRAWCWVARVLFVVCAPCQNLNQEPHLAQSECESVNRTEPQPPQSSILDDLDDSFVPRHFRRVHRGFEQAPSVQRCTDGLACHIADRFKMDCVLLPCCASWAQEDSSPKGQPPRLRHPLNLSQNFGRADRGLPAGSGGCRTRPLYQTAASVLTVAGLTLLRRWRPTPLQLTEMNRLGEPEDLRLRR